MLRIRQFGFARVHAEERRVELGRAVDDRAGADAAGPRALACGERVLEFAVGERADALDAVAEVAPERADVARAGEAPSEADDRDRAAGAGRAAVHAAAFMAMPVTTRPRTIR